MSQPPQQELTITNMEFRAMLDWHMCSDPWPIPGDLHRQVIKTMLDRCAKQRGFADWAEAYHYHEGEAGEPTREGEE